MTHRRHHSAQRTTQCTQPARPRQHSARRRRRGSTQRTVAHHPNAARRGATLAQHRPRASPNEAPARAASHPHWRRAANGERTREHGPARPSPRAALEARARAGARQVVYPRCHAQRSSRARDASEDEAPKNPRRLVAAPCTRRSTPWPSARAPTLAPNPDDQRRRAALRPRQPPIPPVRLPHPHPPSLGPAP
ncbi:hypothetical protein HYPSUDRAFT_200019 [Hypholoma sublateritium FD-334 SS-4]|uniref:Uncharacterized protein n=1 Tax=Hypholoma sublateritium (strain FD-334 SS-4) TaxID=945553 RepID=A0A0D2P2G3_HYPSF|nr:hypothetical protein HYPSUDRAFT_200019 [Hypholoma sublateritium FD-334 SS-4]